MQFHMLIKLNLYVLKIRKTHFFTFFPLEIHTKTHSNTEKTDSMYVCHQILSNDLHAMFFNCPKLSGQERYNPIFSPPELGIKLRFKETT